MVTRILHSDSHIVDVVLLSHLSIAVLESGIAESEAEGIAHGHLEGVEVTIAYVDILLVVGVIHVLHVTLLTLVQHVDARILVDGEVLRTVGIRELHGPSHRELT